MEPQTSNGKGDDDMINCLDKTNTSDTRLAFDVHARIQGPPVDLAAIKMESENISKNSNCKHGIEVEVKAARSEQELSTTKYPCDVNAMTANQSPSAPSTSKNEENCIHSKPNLSGGGNKTKESKQTERISLHTSKSESYDKNSEFPTLRGRGKGRGRGRGRRGACRGVLSSRGRRRKSREPCYTGFFAGCNFQMPILPTPQTDKPSSNNAIGAGLYPFYSFPTGTGNSEALQSMPSSEQNILSESTTSYGQSILPNWNPFSYIPMQTATSTLPPPLNVVSELHSQMNSLYPQTQPIAAAPLAYGVPQNNLQIPQNNFSHSPSYTPNTMQQYQVLNPSLSHPNPSQMTDFSSGLLTPSPFPVPSGMLQKMVVGNQIVDVIVPLATSESATSSNCEGISLDNCPDGTGTPPGLLRPTTMSTSILNTPFTSSSNYRPIYPKPMPPVSQVLNNIGKVSMAPADSPINKNATFSETPEIAHLTCTSQTLASKASLVPQHQLNSTQSLRLPLNESQPSAATIPGNPKRIPLPHANEVSQVEAAVTIPSPQFTPRDNSFWLQRHKVNQSSGLQLLPAPVNDSGRNPLDAIAVSPLQLTIPKSRANGVSSSLSSSASFSVSAVTHGKPALLHSRDESKKNPNPLVDVGHSLIQANKNAPAKAKGDQKYYNRLVSGSADPSRKEKPFADVRDCQHQSKLESHYIESVSVDQHLNKTKNLKPETNKDNEIHNDSFKSSQAACTGKAPIDIGADNSILTVLKGRRKKRTRFNSINGDTKVPRKTEKRDVYQDTVVKPSSNKEPDLTMNCNSLNCTESTAKALSAQTKVSTETTPFTPTSLESLAPISESYDSAIKPLPPVTTIDLRYTSSACVGTATAASFIPKTLSTDTVPVLLTPIVSVVSTPEPTFSSAGCKTGSAVITDVSLKADSSTNLGVRSIQSTIADNSLVLDTPTTKNVKSNKALQTPKSSGNLSSTVFNETISNSVFPGTPNFVDKRTSISSDLGRLAPHESHTDLSRRFEESKNKEVSTTEDQSTSLAQPTTNLNKLYRAENQYSYLGPLSKEDLSRILTDPSELKKYASMTGGEIIRPGPIVVAVPVSHEIKPKPTTPHVVDNLPAAWRSENLARTFATSSFLPTLPTVSSRFKSENQSLKLSTFSLPSTLSNSLSKLASEIQSQTVSTFSFPTTPDELSFSGIARKQNTSTGNLSSPIRLSNDSVVKSADMHSGSEKAFSPSIPATSAGYPNDDQPGTSFLKHKKRKAEHFHRNPVHSSYGRKFKREMANRESLTTDTFVSNAGTDGAISKEGEFPSRTSKYLKAHETELLEARLKVPLSDSQKQKLGLDELTFDGDRALLEDALRPCSVPVYRLNATELNSVNTQPSDSETKDNAVDLNLTNASETLSTINRNNDICTVVKDAKSADKIIDDNEKTLNLKKQSQNKKKGRKRGRKPGQRNTKNKKVPSGYGNKRTSEMISLGSDSSFSLSCVSNINQNERDADVLSEKKKRKLSQAHDENKSANKKTKISHNEFEHKVFKDCVDSKLDLNSAVYTESCVASLETTNTHLDYPKYEVPDKYERNENTNHDREENKTFSKPGKKKFQRMVCETIDKPRESSAESNEKTNIEIIEGRERVSVVADNDEHIKGINPKQPKKRGRKKGFKLSKSQYPGVNGKKVIEQSDEHHVTDIAKSNNEGQLKENFPIPHKKRGRKRGRKPGQSQDKGEKISTGPGSQGQEAKPKFGDVETNESLPCGSTNESLPCGSTNESLPCGSTNESLPCGSIADDSVHLAQTTKKEMLSGADDGKNSANTKSRCFEHKERSFREFKNIFKLDFDPNPSPLPTYSYGLKFENTDVYLDYAEDQTLETQERTGASSGLENAKSISGELASKQYLPELPCPSDLQSAHKGKLEQNVSTSFSFVHPPDPQPLKPKVELLEGDIKICNSSTGAFDSRPEELGGSQMSQLEAVKVHSEVTMFLIKYAHTFTCNEATREYSCEICFNYKTNNVFELRDHLKKHIYASS